MQNQHTTVPAWQELLYKLLWRARRILKPAAPTAQTGMGALPHAKGAGFRVWAPHAEAVFVTGAFNRWSRWRHPLSNEGSGYWSTDVAAAQAGDVYKYVILNDGRALLRTDPYALDVAGGFADGVICQREVSMEMAPFQMPNWNELVIYELHVGTFAESPGGPPGDFHGVIDKLPYLRDLGINALELLPIAEFNGEFSWGYNPAHPFAVTRTYGGRDAFRQLVQAAHAHGIAVIVDVVYNHFGPEGLSLWQFDGWYENGKGGVYFYNDWRSKTPWADTRPDYGRTEVRQYIRDNALLWLEEYGVDGLRWDATAYIRNVHGHEGDAGSDIPEGWGLMRWVNDELNARQPWKISIAEDLRGNGWITKETNAGGAGFDAQWDERFVHPVRQALLTLDDADRDMVAVRDAIAARYNGDAFERILYTESHDEVANGKARVPEEIAPGKANTLFARRRAVLGAALVFTTPGIPMIFQGQEFLEDGWFDDHDPLDWGKARRYAGMVRLYRDLIRLRRNLDGATRGLTGQHVDVYQVDNDQKLIAFHRWAEGGAGDDVVVVANFANRAQVELPLRFPYAGRWRLRFNSDRRVYDRAFTNLGADVTAVADPATAAPLGLVTIGPYAALIFSQ